MKKQQTVKAEQVEKVVEEDETLQCRVITATKKYVVVPRIPALRNLGGYIKQLVEE